MLGLTIRNTQVAIAGKVIQAVTKEAMAGAVVEIIKMPAKFERILQLKELQAGDQWGRMKERGDRRITQTDGTFFFTDLPVGEYTIRAAIPRSTTRYKAVERTYQVVQNDASELQTATGDLAILPTGLQGKILANQKAVPFAKIKLVGGAESTITDTTGAYRFTGLEASGSGTTQILFQISSPDHSTQQQSVVLQQGVMTDIDFSLD